MNNVIITPHMSGDTEDYLDDLGQLFVNNLRRFCTGKPLQNVVEQGSRVCCRLMNPIRSGRRGMPNHSYNIPSLDVPPTSTPPQHIPT